MAQNSNPAWRPARVLENRSVAAGSMWITLEAADDLPAAFEPGHVLGLGLKVDERLMRHAYTVSRGEAEARRFAHLYRIIPSGRLTPRLAGLSEGDEVFFHGPFHTPIQHEIQSSAQNIVLIATGTGVGPLFGYAEKALSEGEIRPMTLIGGFHSESDICLVEDLERLKDRYENFEWHYSVTQPSSQWHGLTGRVTECVPKMLDHGALGITHFHLVGNGNMVHLMRSVLHRTGISPGRVSIETYFNHHAVVADTEVEEVASRFN